jgi:hypothetical protein
VKTVKSLIGRPYRRLGSIFRRWNRLWRTKGENCVSLVRKGAGVALGVDPKWTIPDHITESKHVYLIGKKGNPHRGNT